MKPYLTVAVVLLTLAFGITLGWQIGHAQCETEFAKVGLILTVQELDKLNQQKKDALIEEIRTQMFISVTEALRLQRNPFWRIRYPFENPFDDRITQHFLPIAEQESRPIGEEYFPKDYPPQTSGTLGK